MKKTISRIFVGVMTAAMLIGASVLGVSAATATATQPCDGAHEGWTQFSVNSTTLAAGGTYYLAEDIDRTGALTIRSNGTADNPAILCLNGHNIKATQATKPTYLVQFLNGTLKLCNCKDSGGNISGGTTSGVIVGSNINNVCNLSVYDNVHFDGGTYSNAASGWHATPMQVNDYSTLTMYGGTISNNTCTATVGEATAVYVQGGKATFIMHDGTISGNSGRTGGAVRINNGTFTMTGGTISQNTASNVGGGVYSYKGAVTVSGSAVIKENSCTSGGGGICAEGGVTLSIEGNAAIQGNKAPSKNGGGIWMLAGTVNMTGGTISGNTAGNGGGIFLDNGTVTMTGGTISNNTAASAHNHGIHVGSGSFTMNGKNARIEEDDKGAVYSGTNGVFNLVEGTVSTTGSRGALITNGKITVSGGQVYGGFEEGGQPERIVITGGKFARDPSAYVGTSDKGAVIAVANTGSDKNTYPYQVIISSHSHADDAQGTTWNYIAKAGEITVPGHYYLAGDIVSGQINIKPEASPVTLCLNGHNISSTDADFPLFAQGDIKLCNCSATSGNISGGKTRTVIFGGGTEATASNAEIYDNVHIDNGALGNAGQGWVGMVMVNPYSTLTMYGGTVSNNKVTAGSLTSAVLLNGGVFNLVGGTISGNEVANYGGGVLVAKNSVFNMSGGEISGNTANTTSYGGGGVYVEQGVFNLSGDGVIKENTVPNTNGGGVFVINNGTFNMNGGKLIGNTATSTGDAGHGGAVCVHSKGHFLMSGGEITGSTQEKNTIVVLASENSAVVSGGAVNGTLNSNKIKLTGGKFSFKPTVNHLGTDAGMLSIMSNTGADATVYPYVVGKGYNRVGEFMDFQSSLNLTITLGADVNFTADGVSATVNGQSVAPVVGDGFVTVPVSGIVAKAMDDVYTVVVTDGANTLYSEAVSVRELAGEWYADEAHSADNIMLADLINYGIAAQKEFEGEATMTALGAGTTAVPVWNATEGAGVDAAYTDKVAVTLSLKDKIELNVYVRDEAATVAGVAGTAVTNEAGETVTRFTFDDIAVKDAKNPVAFAVTLSDGSVFNVKYSIADYVIQAQNGTQSDLIKALMKYVDSVSKYLAQ